MRQEKDNRQDNRMPPQKRWRLALATLLTFGLVTVLTGSETPLADGWPVIADLYEHYERRQRDGLGRRHTPHV